MDCIHHLLIFIMWLLETACATIRSEAPSEKHICFGSLLYPQTLLLFINSTQKILVFKKKFKKGGTDGEGSKGIKKKKKCMRPHWVYFNCSQLFSNESVLPIRWPKYWSFSFSISPFNEYSELISFRIDWLDLLAVQGTLKSLP